MQYRTEIYIAADRYVCLQLPDFIPQGRATVTVTVFVGEADPIEAAVDRESDARDHDTDIEWWDEFDGDDPRRA